jgi:hypothetical protein
MPVRIAGDGCALAGMWGWIGSASHNEERQGSSCALTFGQKSGWGGVQATTFAAADVKLATLYVHVKHTASKSFSR